MSENELIIGKLDELKNLVLELKKAPPPQPEPPDRIDFEEARIVLGTEAKPVSRAWLYKETSEGSVPHECFGRRLVFSRKKLVEWVECRTLKVPYMDAIVEDNLQKSAEKKLR